MIKWTHKQKAHIHTHNVQSTKWIKEFRMPIPDIRMYMYDSFIVNWPPVNRNRFKAIKYCGLLPMGHDESIHSFQTAQQHAFSVQFYWIYHNNNNNNKCLTEMIYLFAHDFVFLLLSSVLLRTKDYGLRIRLRFTYSRLIFICFLSTVFASANKKN